MNKRESRVEETSLGNIEDIRIYSAQSFLSVFCLDCILATLLLS